MTPQQQAVAAVLAKLGIPADKIDGAMIDALVQAVGAAAPAAPTPPAANADPNAPKPPVPPAMNADPTPPVPPKPPVAANADQESPKKDEPAKNGETDDNDPAKMAAKYREAFAREIAAVVAPLQAELATVKALAGGATSKLALAEAAKDRAEVAAFVEKNKDRLHPWELDEKVAKEKGTVTVLDQLLSLPTATVATFAEGKVTPRQAAMRQIENRPKGLARYAEKIPAPTEGATQADEVSQGLAASRLGRQVAKEREDASKGKLDDATIAKFGEIIAKGLAASKA